MTDMTHDDKIDSAKLLLQGLMTLFLASIVAMNGWAMKQLIDLDKQQAVNTAYIQSFLNEGTRFSQEDYERESSILLRLIDDIDTDLDKLQDRVHDLEIK